MPNHKTNRREIFEIFLLMLRWDKNKHAIRLMKLKGDNEHHLERVIDNVSEELAKSSQEQNEDVMFIRRVINKKCIQYLRRFK